VDEFEGGRISFPEIMKDKCDIHIHGSSEADGTINPEIAECFQCRGDASLLLTLRCRTTAKKLYDFVAYA
jgi:hypothetical protein